jgi:hypothetical protein
MGGAAGTGLALTLVRKKGVGDWFDLIFAAGMGALGVLAGGTLRGATADLAAGMIDGAAAYVGSRIPEIIGTKSPSYPVQSYPVQVSYVPEVSTPAIGGGGAIGSNSVVEI